MQVCVGSISLEQKKRHYLSGSTFIPLLQLTAPTALHLHSHMGSTLYQPTS